HKARPAGRGGFREAGLAGAKESDGSVAEQIGSPWKIRELPRMSRVLDSACRSSQVSLTRARGRRAVHQDSTNSGKVWGLGYHGWAAVFIGAMGCAAALNISGVVEGSARL